MVTATFGPRYTWSSSLRHYSIFGQALAGEANAFHSVFPAREGALDSTNSLALQVGGGVNLPVTRHISIRALQVDWLHTQLPNNSGNVQNNLRMGAGLIYRF
jgi:hypothetical protein